MSAAATSAPAPLDHPAPHPAAEASPATPRVAAGVAGWGSALPPGRLTNAELEARLDTSDDWIVERTGIHERRVGGSTLDLAVEAGAAALARAGSDPASVDLVVLATSTPERTIPATAALCQARLGTGGGAVDVNAACAGFVYALHAGYGAVATGCRRVLVIGADAMSRITDADDRGTAILFGDGAGAVLLEAPDGTRGPDAPAPGLLGLDLGTDGAAADILWAPLGGTIRMDGREVFRRAVRATVASAQAALADAGLTADDVDLFVPHQANVRILHAAAERLGIDDRRLVAVLADTGNTSAGSIPLALASAADAGRLTDGAVVLTVGFGAGMTWASLVLRWGPA